MTLKGRRTFIGGGKGKGGSVSETWPPSFVIASWPVANSRIIAIGLPPLSSGRNSIPVSPPRANRSLPVLVVKMESACETKPSPTVAKLKPIEAPPETFRFEQVPQ
nr:uncharacterized protein LOC109190215 isoform X2 [Ipomoea batatas]